MTRDRFVSTLARGCAACGGKEGGTLCNLYAVMSNQEAIRDWARVMNDSTGNLPPMSGVFPDYAAPIVRNQPEGRELALVRWGMPTLPKYLVGRKTDPGVTNIRNVNSAHWRLWLGVESQCVVPFTSFSENEVMPDGLRPPIWFALSETRSLAFLESMTSCGVPKVDGADGASDRGRFCHCFRRPGHRFVLAPHRRSCSRPSPSGARRSAERRRRRG